MGSSKRGFTLIELLVVIAIIAILAAILLPVFARVQGKAEQASCQSNLKQLGNAFMMYTQDYDEKFPSWNSGVFMDAPTNLIRQNPMELTLPYIKSRLVCQGHRRASSIVPDGGTYLYFGSMRKANYSYWTNDASFPQNTARPIASLNWPAELLMVGETPVSETQDWIQDQCTPTNCSNNQYDGYYFGSGFVHFQGQNVCYADGHSKWVKQEFVCAEGSKARGTSRYWDYNAP